MSKECKKILISGTTGYFGRICKSYFEEQGCQVYSATRHSESDIYFDLDRPEDIANTKINFPIDLFIHTAAAHEVTCQKEPFRAIAQNVIGTKAALDFCVKNGIKHFVYLSTFHVFGKPQGLITENTCPFPSNDYGLSHLQAEEYVQMYTRENKINGLVLRPTNFFGVPEQLKECKRWTLVPLAFCKDAIQKNSITLQSTGEQLRNFISITDICKVIETVFNNNSSPSHTLLHVPGPETISIRSLAYLVQDVLKSEYSKIIEVKIPKGATPYVETFDYKSIFLPEIYQPKDTLKPFIKALCYKLIKEGEDI
jgi:UDP-glucose 4-epimerase